MAAGCCDVVVVVVAVAAVAAVVIAVAVVAVIAVAAGFHGNALIQVSCELEKKYPQCRYDFRRVPSASAVEQLHDNVKKDRVVNVPDLVGPDTAILPIHLKACAGTIPPRDV